MKCDRISQAIESPMQFCDNVTTSPKEPGRIEQKKYKDYEDYFMNRSVADIMEEYSEHRDEWQTIPTKKRRRKRRC